VVVLSLQVVLLLTIGLAPVRWTRRAEGLMKQLAVVLDWTEQRVWVLARVEELPTSAGRPLKRAG
jgi:hypothetical protein